MRRFLVILLAMALMLSSLLSACANLGNPGTGQVDKTVGEVVSEQPVEKDFEDFDYNSFKTPTMIDNPWYSLASGTQYILTGYTIEDGEEISHTVVITVTDLTKVIDGVQSMVTYDVDYSGDQIAEMELAFYAQDDQGQVWRMGEHPEAYEEGVLEEAPTWFAGIKDAKAGITMRANPQPGNPSYSQGWGPAVDFTDRGQVADEGLQVCIPLGCLENVLVIRESSRAEENAYQYKYYAAGLNNIRIDWQGTDQTQEVLELSEVKQLTPEALAEIRAKAIELEQHAYQISQDVYGLTPPME